MKKSKLSLVMYIAAAVMGVLFIVMVISSVNYIKSYCESYGMTMGDMGAEAYTYILTNSIAYLAYGLLLLAAGRVLEVVSGLKCDCGCECECDGAEEACECACACEEAPAAEAAEEVEEAWSMAKVPPLYTSKSFIKH